MKVADFSRTNLSREEIVFADTINTLLESSDIIQKYESRVFERVGDFTADKITEDWLSVIENN